MIINVYMDKEKDKELIDWLNSFTNRSSAIRIFLYQAMREQGNIPTKSKSNIVDKPDNQLIEIDNAFINGLNGF